MKEKIIAEMQMDLVKISGIQSLKIKHNNVLGYFVETPATHADRMLSPPLSDTFIHRQTTAIRFVFRLLNFLRLKPRF